MTRACLFRRDKEYQNYAAEGLFGNCLCVLCVFYGGLVVYMVTKPEFRRCPTPEYEPLLWFTRRFRNAIFRRARTDRPNKFIVNLIEFLRINKSSTTETFTFLPFYLLYRVPPIRKTLHRTFSVRCITRRRHPVQLSRPNLWKLHIFFIRKPIETTFSCAYETYMRSDGKPEHVQP